MPMGTAPRSVHLGGGMAVPSHLATQRANVVHVNTWSMVAEIFISGPTLRATLRRNGCYRGPV
jgi:hypothetical protein